MSGQIDERRRWLARALAGTGMTHVFFVDSVLRGTCSSSEIKGEPILAHSEKAAAYMADGYARIAGRPGVCMAQSVGAANLASGLRDTYLGHSPVIALTGRKEPPSSTAIPIRRSLTPALRRGDEILDPVHSTAELPRLFVMPGAPHWQTHPVRPISISAGCRAT